MGLNVYDFEARIYQPDVPRTWTLDPKSELFYSTSPYAFLNNNPILFIDPSGMSSENSIFDDKYKDFINGYEGRGGFMVNATGGPGDPPAPGAGTNTGNAQGKLPNGAPNGIDSPAQQLQEVVITTPKKSDSLDNTTVGLILDMSRFAGGSAAFDQAVVDTYKQTQNLDDGHLRWLCITGTALMAEKFDTSGTMGSSIQYGYGMRNIQPLSRIQVGTLQEFKSLIRQLSKPSSELTKLELKQFERMTKKFGGNLRYDLKPVKGKILKPHVQVEGLGTSVASRHIWLGH